MFNTKQRSLFVLLAFVGMVAFLAEVNAFWSKGPQHIIDAKALLANPVISGVVYDIDGTLLTSKVVDITVKNINNVVIGSGSSSTSNGTYSVTVNGTPVPSNVMKVIYKQQNGTESVTFTVSYLQAIHKIHPIVPR